MIEVYDNDTGARLGTMPEEHLQFLIDQLEEESSDDQDYYINRSTLDLFEQRGADPRLMTFLRGALGEREEMEIRWQRN